MNNLEQLVAEYYDWKDYLIKRNVLVGKRINGGLNRPVSIPAQTCHPFRAIPATCSGERLPGIPG